MTRTTTLLDNGNLLKRYQGKPLYPLKGLTRSLIV